MARQLQFVPTKIIILDTVKKILFSAIALLTMAGIGHAQNLPSYVPANGLVGWWPFNGNANDESGNGLNGTNNSAQGTTDRNNYENQAYLFDGTSSHILIPNSPKLNFENNNSFSFSYWVNANSLSNSQSSLILSKQTGAGETQDGFNSNIEVNSSSNFRISNGSSSGTYTLGTPINTLQINNWYHIVHIFNGIDGKIYINGVLKSATNSNGIAGDNTSDLLIGKPNWVAGNVKYFHGKIDDIAIYNRALNQQEITALYQGGSTSINCLDLPSNLQQGLVGYWPFCGNAQDESGNGNNGTVNGATLTTDRFGNVGSAYSFDGLDDFIDIGDLNTNENWSLSFWHKLQSLSPTVQYPINCDSGAVYGKGIGVSGSGFFNPEKHFIYDGTSPTSNLLFSSSNLMVGNYYHVNVIKTGLKFYLYINGINETLDSNLADINISHFKIGKRADNKWYYEGDIDDIAIWNRALSQEEITQLYNQGICKTSITVTDTLLIHTGITAYNPVAYQNTLKVWPNPGNQDITLDAGNLASMAGWKYKVANTLGQTVVNETAISQQQTLIDLSTWGGNGIYYLHLINPQGHAVEIKKIVLAP